MILYNFAGWTQWFWQGGPDTGRPWRWWWGRPPAAIGEVKKANVGVISLPSVARKFSWQLSCSLPPPFYLHLLVLFLLFVVNTDWITSIYMISFEYSKIVTSSSIDFCTKHPWFFSCFSRDIASRLFTCVDSLFIFRCGLTTALCGGTATSLALVAYYL